MRVAGRRALSKSPNAACRALPGPQDPVSGRIQVPTSPTPIKDLRGAFTHSEGITDIYLRHGGTTRPGFCSTDFALISQAASPWQERGRSALRNTSNFSGTGTQPSILIMN